MAQSIPAQRRALKAEIKRKRKEVIPRLKQKVKADEKARKKRLKDCQKACKDAQRKARQRAKVARRKLEQVIKRAKARAAETCKSCKVIDEKGLEQITHSIEQLEKERQEIEKLKREASSLISERGRAGGRRSAERRAESDHEVLVNLGEDKDLIDLFKKNRAKFKTTKYQTRTEAFFDWLHNHPEALDELRAKKERKYEAEAERLYAERKPEPQLDDLEQCKRELAELKAAEKFLSEAEDVPF